MMLYIIGPMTFQMIVIGLFLKTIGVDYASSQGNKEREDSGIQMGTQRQNLPN